MNAGSTSTMAASSNEYCMRDFPWHQYVDCGTAQGTKAYRRAKALSEEEVVAIHAAALKTRKAATPATLCRMADGGEYRTTWLHAKCAASYLTDPIYHNAIAKLLNIMHEADASAGWGLLSGSRCFSSAVRCIEFHEYEATQSLRSDCARNRKETGICTGAASPTHFDSGSLVTLDLMLSPAGAFGGGAFTTPETDGTTTVHDFERGDAIVFVSHKYHHCLPVTMGLREVLVIELWAGPERKCPHRCLLTKGECSYTNEQEGSEPDELLPFVA